MSTVRFHTCLDKAHGHATGLHVTGTGSPCLALRAPAASLSRADWFHHNHYAVQTALLNTLYTSISQKLRGQQQQSRNRQDSPRGLNDRAPASARANPHPPHAAGGRDLLAPRQPRSEAANPGHACPPRSCRPPRPHWPAAGGGTGPVRPACRTSRRGRAAREPLG